jgi:hypothetical protein
MITVNIKKATAENHLALEGNNLLSKKILWVFFPD